MSKGMKTGLAVMVAALALGAGIFQLAAIADQTDKPGNDNSGNDKTGMAGPVAEDGIWQADLGNGFYRNPILHADYSDPDVVAVGDDFYMTASSFNAAPGLPILHSTDLVNWRLINYALPEQVPLDNFAVPQHGNGVWAPNIRYHDNRFWIFYPDPDYGIYVTQAEDPAGIWSAPRLILPGKGIIDPTPLWDDDGRAWLLHAWARSRSGINNILSLREMAPDASWVSDQATVVVDGNKLPGYRTLEGPKFYKKNGLYYIYAPAGGVDVGWQSVFRSEKIEGPYQDRIVMDQGNTTINGPHQGAWVSTSTGEDWFVHFQGKKAYGRIVHLQPMSWRNGWPVIGTDPDGDGIGQPVLTYRKPAVAKPATVEGLAVSDDFNGRQLALQWQWNANYRDDWYSLSENPGFLRLYPQAKPRDTGDNLWMTPSLLLQKIPAEQFELRTRIQLPDSPQDLDAGLILFGEDYAWIGIKAREQGEPQIVYVQCHGARTGCDESVLDGAPLTGDELELRLVMQPGAAAIFSYRQYSAHGGDEAQDPGRFRVIGEHFQAIRGRWVGARVGLFAVTDNPENAGFIDVDSFRFNAFE